MRMPRPLALKNAWWTPLMLLTTPANSDSIVRPAPILAVDRDTARDRPVDVGKVPRLDVAVGPAGAGEYPDRVRDLLFQVHADTGAAGIPSHHRGVGGLTGDLRERDSVLKFSRRPRLRKPVTLNLPGWPHNS